MKNFKIILICLFCLLSFTACSNKTNDDTSTSEDTVTNETATPVTTDMPSESADSEEATVVYEGIFLDNQEILDLFAKVRGEEAPYETVTKEFHVTTEFMPSEAHSKWYGEKITVHITKYKSAEIKMDDGNMTANEGFKAEVTSDNEKLNEYLKSLNKNFHITGSYKDGAKYTDQIDFSDGTVLDETVEGTFGGFYSDGTYRFE